MSYNVGAGILSIITESLYDKPIVVFREYVQNSMDSILKENNPDDYEVKIWKSGDDLFFLDNGKGIDPSKFFEEMTKIGDSSKRRQKNLGYKGIGRLSGVPYCKKLIFVNICDYKKSVAQAFTIDSILYDQIKVSDRVSGMSFEQLMNEISIFSDKLELSSFKNISEEIQKNSAVLEKTNTGFLVVLQDISEVLRSTIEADDFFNRLQWLLPVDFQGDLYNCDQRELFEELTAENNDKVIPVNYCKISYNNTPILRPIKKEMFRDFVCKSDFKFAVGFHTFRGDKIFIDKGNAFSGIRIYMDNMLLCDENELLQSLDNYNLLEHSLNGQIQSVRGIGAMIYITDKINISANARRTFIEVTDNDSLEFLRLLATFVNNVYDTRYALSNYASAVAKQEQNTEKILELESIAIQHLKKLGEKNVALTVVKEEENFDNLSPNEKKRRIKKIIVSQIDENLKVYLSKLTTFNLKNAYLEFINWLTNKYRSNDE